ncbi:protein TPX2-like isoform X2 [Selaginella moellendorffii]|uniref:protein TPX2-like isoform X2 n=1 Tax=Selaginella moellendorffii TaxID=88036 RepID=UPI000D1C2602|nr:protein TPX2-like isoform X2 [Selaginella moellendorffii]|eukprot:XP_024518019.1 protein TPX2-like isoform X2 [Selaginella moellendorffii]
MAAMAMVLGPMSPLSCHDICYEFCAPRFFDFCVDETEEQVRAVERWFEIAAGYEPSPCAFSDSKQDQITHPDRDEQLKLKLLIRLDNQTTDTTATTTSLAAGSDLPEVIDLSTPKKNEFIVSADTGSDEVPEDSARMQPGLTADFPAKRLWEPAVVKKQMKRHTHDTTKKKKAIAKQQTAPTPQGNSCKRRKLDGGQKQAHKYTPAPTVPQIFQLSTDKRAQMHRKGGHDSVSKMGDLSTFVSVAEQVQRFHLRTPAPFQKQNKPKLTLSRPKDPELETSSRSRPPRVKSATELEEEILSKMPKFKARPANKKILQAPTLPAFPRSTPELPRFQEFNLRTNERAMQHTSLKCVEQPLNLSTKKKQRRKSAPAGHISIPDRPRAKSSDELVQDERAKVPKFKALPFNKKVFESRGDSGIYRHQKRHVTVPLEFNFATKERCHREVLKGFRRLSLDSHPRPIRGKTIAKPFHLLTEERGSAKMGKFMEELSKEMTSETLSRIPKANLLPFTTDFPNIPAKPAQKPCTRPEPFRLESLTRHEQEVQRLAEDRARADKQRAELSRFRAQPISCSGAVFVPGRSRKPLTEIKEFNLKADNRAIQRAAFEKKIVEKQSMYKQLKEELELARKEEEERFVRALRCEMIPQARPVPLFDRPYVTQRSTKSLTLPISPHFNLPLKHQHHRGTYRKYRMR